MAKTSCDKPRVRKAPLTIPVCVSTASEEPGTGLTMAKKSHFRDAIFTCKETIQSSCSSVYLLLFDLDVMTEREIDSTISVSRVVVICSVIMVSISAVV